MVDVIIENEQDKVEFTDDCERAVRDVCAAALNEEECDFNAQISVTVTDDERVRAVNLEQRGIDRATDVLSFPMLEFDENGTADGEYETDGDYIMLGDIVISAERAREQANEYGHSFLREISFLTAHSMLHLLGYDHEEEDEERIMFKKQEDILSLLGITRDIGEIYEKEKF